MNAYDSPPPRHRSQAGEPRLDSHADFYAPGREEEAAPMLLAEVSAPPPWFSLAAGAVALGVWGALWLLSVVLPAGWVAGGAVACTAGAAAWALVKVRAAGQALSWTIGSEDDLQLARGVAEMDMKSAATMMSRVCGTLAFCLFNGQLAAALALVIFCVGVGPWATRIEGRFQVMEASTPALATRFSRIVRAWKEPRWSLPPEV